MERIYQGQEEGKRIVNNLNDKVDVFMSSLKSKLLDVQESIADIQELGIVQELDSLIQKSAMEVRSISRNMTPPSMTEYGLEGGIESLREQLIEHGIETSLDINGLGQINAIQKEVVIFRIIQRLVYDISRYANARSVKIITEVDKHSLHIIIISRGEEGMENTWEEASNIDGVNSRIQYLDGTLVITNAGLLTIKIQIPL